jgi:hypothetical protein
MGPAVEIDGKYFLLDFVEAGIERRTDIIEDMPIQWDKYYKNRLKKWAEKNLTGFDSEEIKGIARILERIEISNPIYATIVYSAIQMHSWKFVNFPLRDILIDSDPIEIPTEKIHQAAIRKGRSIYIQKKIWDRMDLLNRVGLVFHEALYALSNVGKDSSGNPIQKSWGVRQLLTELFITGTNEKAIGRALHFQVDHIPLLPGLDEFHRRGNPVGWDFRIDQTVSFSYQRYVYLYDRDDRDEHRHSLYPFFSDEIGYDSSFVEETKNILKVCEKLKFPRELYFITTTAEVKVEFSSYRRPEGEYENLKAHFRVSEPDTEMTDVTKIKLVSNANECADLYRSYVIEQNQSYLNDAFGLN